MTTINEIITEGQKKRHNNHVNAGKNIKKKWKQEVVEEFKRIIERKIDYYRQSKEDCITKNGVNKVDIEWYDGVFDILDEINQEIEKIKEKKL